MKILACLLLTFTLVRGETYFGLGPAFSSGSDNLHYWFSGGQFLHRGNFDTKLLVDCASDFEKSVFLSGSLGFNYYFIKDFILAGMNFGFGSDFDKFGFVGGLSLGVALAERTFFIEPNFQTLFKQGKHYVAGLKVGMMLGK